MRARSQLTSADSSPHSAVRCAQSLLKASIAAGSRKLTYDGTALLEASQSRGQLQACHCPCEKSASRVDACDTVGSFRKLLESLKLPATATVTVVRPGAAVSVILPQGMAPMVPIGQAAALCVSDSAPVSDDRPGKLIQSGQCVSDSASVSDDRPAEIQSATSVSDSNSVSDDPPGKLTQSSWRGTKLTGQT